MYGVCNLNKSDEQQMICTKKYVRLLWAMVENETLCLYIFNLYIFITVLVIKFRCERLYLCMDFILFPFILKWQF